MFQGRPFWDKCTSRVLLPQQLLRYLIFDLNADNFSTVFKFNLLRNCPHIGLACNNYIYEAVHNHTDLGIGFQFCLYGVNLIWTVHITKYFLKGNEIDFVDTFRHGNRLWITGIYTCEMLSRVIIKVWSLCAWPG